MVVVIMDSVDVKDENDQTVETFERDSTIEIIGSTWRRGVLHGKTVDNNFIPFHTPHGRQKIDFNMKTARVNNTYFTL
jgi:hypothetical protein